MKQSTLGSIVLAGGITIVAAFGTPLAAQAEDAIVHDAEYYVLEAQHGEEWAAEDVALRAKLDELKKKHGRPPNLIHIMWDDTAFGDVGIPAIQKVRGLETPRLNTLAEEGILFTRNSASPWNYLYFISTGAGTFDHCTIEHASYGIYSTTSGALGVSNSTVQNSTYGIYTTGTSAVVVSDCQIQDNSHGIYIADGTIDLTSTSFTGNTTHGFHGVGVAPTLLDANMVFTDNGTGFRVSGAHKNGAHYRRLALYWCELWGAFAAHPFVINGL